MKRKLLFCLLLLMAILLCSLVVSMNSVRTEGYFPVSEKHELNGEYFFSIYFSGENLSFSCSRDEYDQIVCDTDVAYHISFKKYTLIFPHAVLLKFEPEEKLDHRMTG